MSDPFEPTTSETPDEQPIPLAPPPKTPFVMPAFAVFVLALLFAAATFGAPMLVLGRASLFGAAVAPEATIPVQTIGATRTATPQPTPVRVLSATATAQTAGSPSLYRVTFVWTLEGARDGDTAVIRFSVGNRVVSEQRGSLEAPVFAGGTLTLATQQECSSEGWSATLVTIRGIAPQGDATARAAGVSCPT